MVIDADAEQLLSISGGRFDDIDAQAAHLHGYGQRYEQLSGGAFAGWYRSFAFGGDLGIHLETANRALAQAASTPSRRHAVCLLDDASPACSLNAGKFSDDHVAWCPEHQVLEGKTAAGMQMCCMDVSGDLLPDEVEMRGGALILHTPGGARELRNLVRTGLSGLTVLNCNGPHPAAIIDFKSSLSDLLWRMITRRGHESVTPGRHPMNGRALAAFRRAREYIHHHLADGISVVALAKSLGLSRRSLESVFCSVIGMGPGAYVRTLQLNQIRRDLLSGTCDHLSIGVIAARRGVWHWSRLSRQYRLLFGELPSQTRLRRVCDLRHEILAVAPH